jgi:hypothetical protein
MHPTHHTVYKISQYLRITITVGIFDTSQTSTSTVFSASTRSPTSQNTQSVSIIKNSGEVS